MGVFHLIFYCNSLFLFSICSRWIPAAYFHPSFLYTARRWFLNIYNPHSSLRNLRSAILWKRNSDFKGNFSFEEQICTAFDLGGHIDITLYRRNASRLRCCSQQYAMEELVWNNGRIKVVATRIKGEKKSQVLTGCCPNRILLTDTGSPCAPNFWFFFFKIFTNAQIAIDYTDYLC